MGVDDEQLKHDLSLFEFREHFEQQITRLDLQAIDVAFASFVYVHEKSAHIRDVVSLLSGYVSKKLNNQDTCLDITKLPLSVLDVLELKHHQQLIDIISQSSLVTIVGQQKSNGTSTDLPLVFDNGGMYLQRYYRYEVALANMIMQRISNTSSLNTDVSKKLFEQLFTTGTNDQIDWQKIAVCIAATRRFTMITGGPGTGKTTTVAKLLCFLHELDKARDKELKVQLVAPTGKASARLTESLHKAREGLPESLQSALNVESGTIHRLLGSRPNSIFFKHNQNNQLHIDVLIVDEASMVDLPLMCKLLEALPNSTRVVLLGDPNQLASVEAGSVLSDICYAATSSTGSVQYNDQTLSTIEESCGQSLPSQYRDNQSTLLQNSIVTLLESHRFTSESGIGKLAAAVVAGDAQGALSILQQGCADIEWQALNSQGQESESPTDVRLKRLVSPRVRSMLSYFKAAVTGDIELAFELLHQEQILCAQRNGVWGVAAINTAMESELAKQGVVDLSHRDYAGRPIMLTENDYSLGLFNGDIGIVIPDKELAGLNKVWFKMPSGEYKGFLVNRLPVHETVYAMTVHKSQGSEFAKVFLCLPEFDSGSGARGASRELFYTGLTRARENFVLFAQQTTLMQCLNRACERSSGLAKRFTGLN